MGGPILSTDLGDSIDILNPVKVTSTVGSVATTSANSGDNELSITGIMTSLALTIGPTVLFLSRTPKVVEMMGELNDNNADRQDDSEADKKDDDKKAGESADN